MFQKLRYKSTPEDHPWLEACWMSTFSYISEILFSLRSQILPMSLFFSIWNTFCLVGNWVRMCGGVVVVVGIDRTQNGIQDCSKLVSLGEKNACRISEGKATEDSYGHNSSLLNISLTSHSKIKKGREVGYPAVEFLPSIPGLHPQHCKKEINKIQQAKAFYS